MAEYINKFWRRACAASFFENMESGVLEAGRIEAAAQIRRPSQPGRPKGARTYARPALFHPFLMCSKPSRYTASGLSAKSRQTLVAAARSFRPRPKASMVSQPS